MGSPHQHDFLSLRQKVQFEWPQDSVEALTSKQLQNVHTLIHFFIKPLLLSKLFSIRLARKMSMLSPLRGCVLADPKIFKP